MAKPEIAPGAGDAGAEVDLTQNQFEAIIESSDDAILSKDSRGVILSWNPAAERMYGYSSEEAIGRPISILIPPHRAGEEQEIIKKVFAGERVEHYETERLTKDGRLIVLSLTVSPVRGPAGEVVRASVIARDVTARNRSIALASRLQEITTALSREITPERTIEVMLDEVVRGMDADAAAVGILDEPAGEIEVAGARGYSPQLIERFRRFPLDGDFPMSEAIRSGEPIWTQSSAELAQRFPAVGDGDSRFEALAVVPLAVGGHPVGAFSLSFTHPHRFDGEEKAFLRATAQQGAHAIERARLYDAERKSAERLSFLADASQLLSSSLEPEKTMQRLAELVVPRLADWCWIDMLDEEGQIRSVAVAHSDPRKVELARDLQRRHPTDPDDATGAPNVIRTGRSELYPEIPDEMLAEGARDEEHLRLIRELGLKSAMVVPLSARGRVRAALTFVSAESDRRFDRKDLELAEDLAGRAALAVDNSILFRREHEAAVTLQHELLPEKLPRLEGVELAAHYDPAGPGLEVGGDWYEVVVLDDGSVAVTIGDVAGRGIPAAAVMGRARAALRAYVLDGYGPEQAVERLDRLLKGSATPEMITLLHLHYDPASGVARYVRAGHPPGLLRLPGGELTDLAGGGTPPLGILRQIDYHAHEVEVPPGGLLLLYTDGLIERRTDDLATSLQRLRESFATGPREPAECLEHLAAAFRSGAAPDDVAMVAMRVAD